MKKILGLIVISTLIFTADGTLSRNQKNSILSDLALENITALARDVLPEVEVNCGETSGVCWMKNGMICFIGSNTYERCSFMGYTYVRCSSPCN